MMASKFPPPADASQGETLLEFPCKFPVKAMGRSDEGFEAMVTGIVLAHAEMYAGEQVTTNSSGAGKYTSVTVVIEALSKDQLDRIYQDLTDCEHILLAL